ncbi:MAG: NHLP bacteriocin export ABC transporter permease/ATPase subunit [Chlorobiaceae bacterium]|nr:NHLP bacteriocin export ABC transporter permease/ATPase subunit [Chlorobiaceae bacterium]
MSEERRHMTPEIKPFSERIRDKYRFQRERYHAALEGLGGLMDDTRPHDLPQIGDPLVAACTVVGNAAGITIIEPPSGSRHPNEDPLQAICRRSGIRARKVTLRSVSRWWKTESGPILAFRKQEMAPVALLPDTRRGYTLFDPAKNETVRVDAAIAGEIDEGQAWLLYRPFPDRLNDSREIFRFGIRGGGGDIALTILYGLAGALLSLLAPILTGILFGSVIPQSSRSQLLQLALIMMASVIAASSFDLARQVVVMRLQTRMDMFIQPALIDRLLNLPIAFFRQYSSGDLAMRVLGISQIRETISTAFLTVILGLLFGLSNFVLLFYYSWRLALLAALMTSLLVGITAWTSYRRIILNKGILAIQGRISGLLGNLVSGIAKIRITGTEKPAFTQWANLFIKERRLAFEAGKLQNTLAVTTASFPVVAMAVIIVSAGGMLTGDRMESGSFIAFTTAFTIFQTALMQSAMTLIESLNVIPLYERIKPLFETIPETTALQTQPEILQGRIEMKNVNFSYCSDAPQILHDIDLIAEPGQFVAIVGGSGSGKSTIMRLLLGFEKPGNGTVFYDGVDLATLNVQAVRRQIGVVMQNGQLQPGFVLQSIIGAGTFTIDDAWEAARMAGIDEEIRNMPMGMYTVIGEGSETISGGQKQRLLIAGALVRKPGIILFDEATSALDNLSQEVVSVSLEGLNATRIVVAHRLSTIRKADRIYCLDNGRVVQQGTYDELMARDGFFRELASRQIA